MASRNIGLMLIYHFRFPKRKGASGFIASSLQGGRRQGRIQLQVEKSGCISSSCFKLIGCLELLNIHKPFLYLFHSEFVIYSLYEICFSSISITFYNEGQREEMCFFYHISLIF